MNTKNSTSDTQLEVSVYGVRAAYWKGFAQRISVPIGALIVIHVVARLVSGFTTALHGFNFIDGFNFTMGSSDTLLIITSIHITAVCLIIVACGVPFLLFLGVKWLIKG